MVDEDLPTDWKNYVTRFRFTADIIPTTFTKFCQDRERLFIRESDKASLEVWKLQDDGIIDKGVVAIDSSLTYYLDVRSSRRMRNTSSKCVSL